MTQYNITLFLNFDKQHQIVVGNFLWWAKNKFSSDDKIHVDSLPSKVGKAKTSGQAKKQPQGCCSKPRHLHPWDN